MQCQHDEYKNASSKSTILYICKKCKKHTGTAVHQYNLWGKWGGANSVKERDFEHCKKRLAFFLFPAGMSLSKLSLAGNNLIIPGQEEFG